jgi:hypothetical protein
MREDYPLSKNIGGIILTTQNNVHNYILTYTLKKFYAENPTPESFCLEDIFHALSGNNRFTSHGRTRDYTVGEHTVRGVWLASMLRMSKEVQKCFLLHDFSEAYLNDIASPFKKLLPDYMKLEEEVQNAIYMKYLGYVPSDEFYKEVKYIDLMMLINEMEQIMKPVDDWGRPNIGETVHIDLFSPMTKHEIKYYLNSLAKELGVHD